MIYEKNEWCQNFFFPDIHDKALNNTFNYRSKPSYFCSIWIDPHCSIRDKLWKNSVILIKWEWLSVLLSCSLIILSVFLSSFHVFFFFQIVFEAISTIQLIHNFCKFYMCKFAMLHGLTHHAFHIFQWSCTWHLWNIVKSPVLVSASQCMTREHS